MAWSKIDDKFWWHRKIRGAGNAAVGAFVRMLSYSADQLSDGFVDQDTIDLIATKREISQLLSAGLIDLVDGGLQLHDFHDYNPTREQALAERAAASERQRRRRHGVADNDSSRRESRRDTTRESRPESRRESHDPVPSRPVRTSSPSEKTPEPQTAKAGATLVVPGVQPGATLAASAPGISAIEGLIERHPLAKTAVAQDILRRWYSNGKTIDDLWGALDRLANSGWACTPETLRRELTPQPKPTVPGPASAKAMGWEDAANEVNAARANGVPA